jgi:WD40 repeat protein
MKRLFWLKRFRAVWLAALVFQWTYPDPVAAQAPADGVLNGHEGAVVMGVFTPDGERVVTASSDQTARLWDVAKSVELRRYTQHVGPLYCLAASGDGRTLVTGSQDNTLRVWDLPLSHPCADLYLTLMDGVCCRSPMTRIFAFMIC